MKYYSFRSNTLFFISLIVLLCCGCKQAYQSSTTYLDSRTNDEKNPPQEPETNVIEKTVSVGVGRGGAVVTSYDGFDTLVHSEQTLIPGESYDDAALKEVCRFGEFAPYAPDHDPHMFRGITYGNGKFVAIGGCCHAIAKTSSDGVNWNQEIKVDKSTVTYGSCPWAGDVTFGDGVFVAFGGGVSMWSADGETWQRVNWENGSRPGGSYRRVDFENGVFFAVGNSGASLAVSYDGKDWFVEESDIEPTKVASGLKFLLIEDPADTTQLKLYDTETLTWLEGASFESSIGSIQFSEDSQAFYLRAGGINFESLDGINWTELGASNRQIDGRFKDTYYSFTRSWGVTASSSRYISNDGVNWRLAEKLQPFNPIIDSITVKAQIEE